MLSSRDYCRIFCGSVVIITACCFYCCCQKWLFYCWSELKTKVELKAELTMSRKLLLSLVILTYFLLNCSGKGATHF